MLNITQDTVLIIYLIIKLFIKSFIYSLFCFFILLLMPLFLFVFMGLLWALYNLWIATLTHVTFASEY